MVAFEANVLLEAIYYVTLLRLRDLWVDGIVSEPAIAVGVSMESVGNNNGEI